jgi:hypothetical protein
MSFRIRWFFSSSIRRPICSFAVCILCVVGTGAARSDVVNIGTFSFDPLNPAADGSPGTNDFGFSNLTEAFALPPEFSVVDALTLTNLQVSLFGPSAPHPLMLGDFGPGFYTPDQLVFLDTVQFTGAELDATLNQTSFTLSDGSFFLANTNAVRATLTPTSGSFLNPGVDLVDISVSGTVVAATPEPRRGVFLLMFLGSAIIALRIRRNRTIPNH